MIVVLPFVHGAVVHGSQEEAADFVEGPGVVGATSPTPEVMLDLEDAAVDHQTANLSVLITVAQMKSTSSLH